MHQASGQLTVETRGPGLVEVTRQVADWIERQAIHTGLLTVLCRHTSASLLINENASGAVRRDLARFFAGIAPEDSDRYEHDEEGLDDMPAHLRTALTNVSLSIPVSDGAMALGTWQGLFLFEHRAAPHRRTLALHLIGEPR
jgi:secondary thiamine-phosphate synthase enzyme